MFDRETEKHSVFKTQLHNSFVLIIKNEFLELEKINENNSSNKCLYLI